MEMSDPTAENLRLAALNYHEFPKPGKLEVRATKPRPRAGHQQDRSSPFAAPIFLVKKEISSPRLVLGNTTSERIVISPRFLSALCARQGYKTRPETQKLATFAPYKFSLILN